MTVLKCGNWRVGDRLPYIPDIVLAVSQAAEKSEQLITWLEPAGFAGRRCRLRQCPLFHCQRRLQVDLSSLHRFVSEPQCDDRTIDTGLKKIHSRRWRESL